jgi:hypothetical protein
MKSIADLQAEHAAAMEKAEAELAIAALAPVTPDSVQLPFKSFRGKGYSRPPLIVFRKASLSRALEIIAGFPVIVPFYKFRGTFLQTVPQGEQDEKSEEQGGPFAFRLDVSQGDGFGPSAKLEFFSRLTDGRLVSVWIDIDGPDYIGGFSALGAGRRPIYGGRGGQEIVGYDFSGNAALNGYSDSLIKWGTGDKKAAHFAYLFQADQEEEAAPADQTHALGQLVNLRDEFQPAAELIESTARADYYRIPGARGGRDCFAAVKPGDPAPANAAGYYELESLKRLKGDLPESGK